ncbi:hypothetical protein AO391_11675 [Pseudomonas marginalis ICMP 9505]|nr:hypothetical protein AO391_11675 [Pseudomonas marginalis ICMP 9505]
MKQVPVSKSERPRVRELWEDAEVGSGAPASLEQRRLFVQLFAKSDDQGGYVSTLPGLMASPDRVMLEALAGQLTARIHGAAQWPLLVALYLPRLGRINASVRKEPGAWSVELEAEEERTAQWLSRQHKRCQDTLTEAFGQPVDVHIRHANPA